jgi:hypothetical protein
MQSLWYIEQDLGDQQFPNNNNNNRIIKMMMVISNNTGMKIIVITNSIPAFEYFPAAIYEIYFSCVFSVSLCEPNK